MENETQHIGTEAEIRELALLLLNDDHGIGEPAYDVLHALLQKFNSRDIIQRVKAVNGRFYIPD
jgi:hypothetical protein